MKRWNAQIGVEVEVKSTGARGLIVSEVCGLLGEDPAVYVRHEQPGLPGAQPYSLRELRRVKPRQAKARFHVVDTGPLHCEVEGLASADIYQILEQDCGWVQGDGTPIRLMEMGVPHKLNTLALLERSAERLAWGKLLRYGIGKDVPDEVAGSYEDDADNPLRWMRGTPLYREMLRQVTAGIGAKDKPDAERFLQPEFRII